jgi:hypothetical protein
VHAQGKPIRIGSTLALTGPLSATAQVHKLVGEIYIEQVNKRGGWLGRPLEWILKDDQSKPDLARTLYEQLVTVDKVDLLMGPYATPGHPVGDGRGAALRQGARAPHLRHPVAGQVRERVPGLVAGLGPGQHGAGNTVFDALAAGPKPPKTVAVVTSKFPSIQFLRPARAR